MAIFLKGALATFIPGSSNPSVITFQLNPETLTHTLIAAAGQATREAPAESYFFTLILDAALPAPSILQTGFVQSQLSALEALTVSTDQQTAPPAVLFCWGRQRVPVRVAALTVIATGFDSQLSTVQAEVQVTLVGLTPAERAALPAPMAAIAEAAYAELAQARIQALITAQTVTDPRQSSGGRII